jgi:hypothetical protein
MPLFARRERPPADVLQRLDRHERFVSWADTSDGSVVAATSFGLWWPFPDGPRRVPWQYIDKVIWQGRTLTLIEADVEDDFLLVERPPVSVTLTVPRDLPPAVRKRVEANIVKSELLAVAGGAVRFVGRRQSGEDGLVWWARLEPATPDTAQVRAAIRARLALLRAASEAGQPR